MRSDRHAELLAGPCTASRCIQHNLPSSIAVMDVSSAASKIHSFDQCRLKALSEGAAAPAPQQQPAAPSASQQQTSQQPQPQQFLRLPVESARKLRFYDRPDLSELVAQHARDKAALTAANEALCQVMGSDAAPHSRCPVWQRLACSAHTGQALLAAANEALRQVRGLASLRH